MAHLSTKDGYRRFADRLNLHPQGAPPSELLYDTLRVFVSEADAALLAQLPVRYFKAEAAARNWKVSPAQARKTLERLCAACLLIDMDTPQGTRYALAPPMAGFFEMTMMRVRDDIDQHRLAEMFHQLVVEDPEFGLDLMGQPDVVPFGRFYVNESVLPQDADLYVLDYERASEMIRQASHLSVSMCFCRHVKSHLGTACNAPMDICLSLGNSADYLVRKGFARGIDAAEGLDLLALAYDNNLVQFGENVQRQPSFICNCCGCCCEALEAVRRFGLTAPIATSNFLPEVSGGCTGCGKCVRACPVEAMAQVSAQDVARPNRQVAKLDERMCLGCGICAKVCPKGHITMKARPQRVLTPIDMVQRTVLAATERGRLQNLIFDNQALASHRAMAAVVGAILRLPPIKQAIARQQLNSIYLNMMSQLKKRRAERK